jgi:hypothetical protein
MNRFIVALDVKLFILLIVPAILVMGCAKSGCVVVSLNNNCNDNIKLCPTCSHIAPGETLKDTFFLSPDAPSTSFEIYRKDVCLARASLTGFNFPTEEDLENEPGLNYFVTITLTSNVNNADDPFDDTFFATSNDAFHLSVTVNDNC